MEPYKGWPWAEVQAIGGPEHATHDPKTITGVHGSGRGVYRWNVAAGIYLGGLKVRRSLL